MTDKPTSTEVLGLEIDSSEIRGAFITLPQGKLSLGKLFRIPLNKSEYLEGNVKPLYIGSEDQMIKQIPDDCLIVTSLAPSETLIRPYTIPLAKTKDIDAVLNFQIEPLIPYPAEEALTDRIILRHHEESTDLTVIIARQDHIANHLEKYRLINIEPEVVTATPAALTAFSRELSPTKKPHFILHLGIDEICCCLIKQGKLLASQSIQSGVGTILTAFIEDKELSTAEALGQIVNYKFAKLTNTPKLAAALKNIENDIVKLVFSIGKQIQGEDITQVLMTGEGSTWSDLPQIISHQIEKEIIEPKITSNFAILKEELQTFAISIGTALSCTPKAEDRINFRQNEYKYPNPWKRLKGPIIRFLGVSTFLAAALFFYGFAFVQKSTDQIKEEYVNLLAQSKISYKEFEEKYAKKNNTTPTLSPIDLTASDIEYRLSFLEQEIKSTPILFPLYPNIPKVSDVLAWLTNVEESLNKKSESGSSSGSSPSPLPGTESSPLRGSSLVLESSSATGLTDSPKNPLFESQEKIDQETRKPAKITLDSFSYKLVRRPEKTKKRDKYQVKVEIEFTPATPTDAREFHDILLKPNDYIDPKTELKWTTDRNKYRASFFLKDQTYYPKI